MKLDITKNRPKHFLETRLGEPDMLSRFEFTGAAAYLRHFLVNGESMV